MVYIGVRTPLTALRSLTAADFPQVYRVPNDKNQPAVELANERDLTSFNMFTRGKVNEFVRPPRSTSVPRRLTSHAHS